MKKFCAVIFALCALTAVACAEEQSWNERKSTHFILYYKQAPEDFVDQVISRSEELYDRIADNLGFTRFDFWTWDDRAKIYIYDDKQDYLESTGMAEWFVGHAQARSKMIYSYPHAKGFLETVLPHELAHIIFREFVGFSNLGVPVWLDEGVASAQEHGDYDPSNQLVKEALANGGYIPLARLWNSNPQLMQDRQQVDIFYAESISLVKYLLQEFGKDTFVIFCQDIRDKKNFEAAMRSRYPFSTIGEFEEAWKQRL